MDTINTKELNNTDICIIGAGPAGTTTSLFLSKMGIPHTIIDGAVFPRDKVCGDALDLKVLRVLNQLDPAIVNKEILNDSNFAKARGCSIIISKNKKHTLDMGKGPSKDSPYPFFLVSKRAYFDNFLVKKINPAYANFVQGTLVKKITKDGDTWTVSAIKEGKEVIIKSKLIVGADGDHSVVLRILGERKIDRENYAGALRQYWKGISGITSSNFIEIYLPKSLPLAYLWIFPLPNGEANVGCGLVSDLISKRSINLKDLFNKLITEDPALKDRFANAVPLEKPVGWGLPLASQRRKTYGDGYLLTGDAAGLVCPTTGEGVGPGMYSGYIAAHYIKRAIAANRYDKEMFVNYDREVYKRLESDIKKYKFLRKISPVFYNHLINILSSLGVSASYFNNNVGKWIKTASDKPIPVDF